MTSPQFAFWERVRHKAATLTPDLAAAFLRGVAQLQAKAVSREVEAAILRGDIEAVVNIVLADAMIAVAFIGFRARLHQVVQEAVTYFAKDLPTKAARLAVSFDLLNPDVIAAVQKLEDGVMQRLTGDLEATVRQALQRGLEKGVGPRVTARALRDVLGLAPNQEAAVANFERMLAAGDREALTRVLRDRRFDQTIAKAFAGDGLTPEQVDAMTAAYRRKMVAFNAETQARTATVDSLKVGQQLSWQSAIDRGIVDGDRLMKRWWHLPGQLDPRPEHEDMDGEVVAFDEPYSNGDTYAGEQDPWNCFIGATPVEGAFVLGLKARYTGPMREIVTAWGYRLTVTPNHPVLTPQGWVPAGELREGAHLFSKRRNVGRIAAIGVDQEQEPTTIEDVFNALAPERPLPAGVTLNLHGDARFLVGDVHVVTTDRELPLEPWQLGDHGVDDRRLLDPAPESTVLVDGAGASGALALGALPPAHRGPRLAEQPFGRSLPFPAQALCVGAAAEWDAPVPQMFCEGAPGVAAFMGKLQEASAGAIARDEVLQVRDFQAVGVHVYDLQSVNGWLLASNIVCSNCHCHDTFFLAPAADLAVL